MEQAWSSEVVVSEPAVIREGNFLVKYFHLLNPVPWFCLGSFSEMITSVIRYAALNQLLRALTLDSGLISEMIIC